MAETKESKPTVNIRPRPGQTELNWREWLLLLGIIAVSLLPIVIEFVQARRRKASLAARSLEAAE